MPCGEDWLSHPLGIVQGFFGESRAASELAWPGLWRGRHRDDGQRDHRRDDRGAPGLAAEPGQPSRVAAAGATTCPLPGSRWRAAGTQLRALAVIDGLASGWWPT